MCEFTGLDFEMAIHEHYDEVLDVIDKLFVYIFEGLRGKFGAHTIAIGCVYQSVVCKAGTVYRV